MNLNLDKQIKLKHLENMKLNAYLNDCDFISINKVITDMNIV